MIFFRPCLWHQLPDTLLGKAEDDSKFEFAGVMALASGGSRAFKERWKGDMAASGGK
jgi:hypothetical protein